MSNLDEILNEDEVKHSIDELCEDITDFSQVNFVHLLWSKKDEIVKGRCYGELDILLANLERAKFLLMSRHSEGEIGE